MKRSVVMAGFALAAGFLGAQGAAADEPFHIRYDNGWFFDGGEAYASLAADKGCFKKQGLDVSMDRGFGSGDTLTKLAAGSYDIGESDFNNMAQFNAAHPENRLIAIFVISDSAAPSVAVLNKSGIKKPKDLVGKTIGDPVGETARVLFPAFAVANGFDPNAVTWVNTSFNLREQLLVQGRADAVAGHMFTLRTSLAALHVKADDITVFRYGDWGVDLFGAALVVKPQWAAEHAAATKSFVRCIAEGIKGQIADPKAAIAAVKARNSLLEDDLELRSLGFANSLVLTKNVRENGLSYITHDRLVAVLKQVSLALHIEPLQPDQVWTDKYLPPQSELKIP